MFVSSSSWIALYINETNIFYWWKAWSISSNDNIFELWIPQEVPPPAEDLDKIPT